MDPEVRSLPLTEAQKAIINQSTKIWSRIDFVMGPILALLGTISLLSPSPKGPVTEDIMGWVLLAIGIAQVGRGYKRLLARRADLDAGTFLRYHGSGRGYWGKTQGGGRRVSIQVSEQASVSLYGGLLFGHLDSELWIDCSNSGATVFYVSDQDGKPIFSQTGYVPPGA